MAVWFISGLIVTWVLISVVLLISLCKTAARLEEMESAWSLPDDAPAA